MRSSECITPNSNLLCEGGNKKSFKQICKPDITRNDIPTPTICNLLMFKHQFNLLNLLFYQSLIRISTHYLLLLNLNEYSSLMIAYPIAPYLQMHSPNGKQAEFQLKTPNMALVLTLISRKNIIPTVSMVKVSSRLKIFWNVIIFPKRLISSTSPAYHTTKKELKYLNKVAFILEIPKPCS